MPVIYNRIARVKSQDAWSDFHPERVCGQRSQKQTLLEDVQAYLPELGPDGQWHLGKEGDELLEELAERDVLKAGAGGAIS